jgi:hypothetical protein
MLLGNDNILSNGSTGISVQNIKTKDNEALYQVRKCRDMRLLQRLTFSKNDKNVIIDIGPNVIVIGINEDITARTLHRHKNGFITESGHKFQKSEHVAGYACKLHFNDDTIILVNGIPIRACKRKRLLGCI